MTSYCTSLDQIRQRWTFLLHVFIHFQSAQLYLECMTFSSYCPQYLCIKFIYDCTTTDLHLSLSLVMSMYESGSTKFKVAATLELLYNPYIAIIGCTSKELQVPINVHTGLIIAILACVG